LEAGLVTGNDEQAMRWDLVEAQPPTGERLTARLAAPSRCPDVFIAVDMARRRYVLVRVPEGEPATLSERTSKGIAVQTVEMSLDGAGKTDVFVEVACLEPAGYAALDVVTGELVGALLGGATIGRVRLVQSVLAKWRRFWSGVPQNLLRKEELLGLFGEVWFLYRWLLPALGPSGATAMWRGPNGARHDFEAPGLAIEVKTSGKLDASHQIHGLEQLLEPAGGVLLFFSLVVREEAGGAESLPRLVSDVRTALTVDQAQLVLFESMLLAAGYEDAHAPEYEKVKLRIRGQGLYRVSEGFPRMVPGSLRGELPVGVSNVAYDIRLEAAGAWLLSHDAGSAAVLLRDMLAQGARRQ
jgi:hypothetical protein